MPSANSIHTLPPAPVDVFVERARQMVAFLAESDHPAEQRSHSREAQLSEWISRWRRQPVHAVDGTQHFVAEELGIIARALNGPAETARLRDARTDDLTWLIARCISNGP
ncbi:MAG: hypothetical protein ACJ8G7_21930 [Rhizobacter sp.]